MELKWPFKRNVSLIHGIDRAAFDHLNKQWQAATEVEQLPDPESLWKWGTVNTALHAYKILYEKVNNVR